MFSTARPLLSRLVLVRHCVGPPVDTSNPAATWTVKSGHHGVAFEAVKVYLVASSRCKSARVLVRQLLGPHLRT